MMFHPRRSLFPALPALFAMLCCATVSRAADIDVFMQPTPNSSSLPNMLVIMDNTANWSQNVSSAGVDMPGTKFDFERLALYTWSQSLPAADSEAARVDVGLMLFSETGSDNPDPSGGYVRSAIRPMNAANVGEFSALVQSLDENDDKGNGAEYALAMHEAYLYFKGENARSGIKAKTDPAVWDEGFVGSYITPDAADVCKKNYVVFISNGSPDSGENNTAEALLTELGGTAPTDPIDLDPKQQMQNWSDEYARFMANNQITTYTIDVLPQTKTAGRANTAMLKSMYKMGGGKYYLVSAENGDPAQQLIDALNDILQDIIAVDTVFAASALPVSINVQNRDTNLNQVYIGMFRPDASRRPRWLGNLKLYEVGLVGDELELVDSRQNPVQDPITGFVRTGVSSYWTHSSDYWEFRGMDYDPSDDPDASVVEKGAAGQMQREYNAMRRFFTCGGCVHGTPLSSRPFSTSNSHITAAALGVADATERADLIDWMRGEDNTNPAESGITDNVRPSVQGDIIHSSPALVNYGDQIVAFYGSNDGLYRAVRGGKDAVTGGGHELWAFAAPEFFPYFKRLRDNETDVKVPYNNPSVEQAVDENRPFFLDGSAAVYTLDADGDGVLTRTKDGSSTGDKAYLYMTPRRGGRFIYALDVIDPDEPLFMWKADAATHGFAELGEVWSTPRVRKIRGLDFPVLIFGAGYDEDVDDRLPSTVATQGRGIMVVNADTGELVWQAGPHPHDADYNLTVPGMVNSIPSEMSVVDLNWDGYADVGYVGDSGGLLWRVNFGDPVSGDSPANWSVHLLADLRNSIEHTDRRKFLYPPDIVPIHEGCDPVAAQAGELAILIGSGDREHPLDMTVYNEVFGTDPHLHETPNRFYMVKDRTPLSSGVTTLTESDLTDVTDTDIIPADSKGWYVVLERGEKVVGNALTIDSQVFFGTGFPPPTELTNDNCSPFGDARIYVMNYCNAAATSDAGRWSSIPGGGLLPPLVPVIVELTSTQTDDPEEPTKTRKAVLAGMNLIPAGITANIDNKKTYWFTEQMD